MNLNPLKKILQALGLALLCISVSSCGTREREVDIAAKKGILLVGNASEPKSLDPHLVTGDPESKLVQSLLEGLTAYHPTDPLKPAPGAAESWTNNPDFSVWTFKLRSNAKWSNGDPVVANDFVYSWQRILSAKLGSEYAEMLYVIRNAEAFHKGQIKDFRQVGVKAPDPHTLEVTLTGSTPYFIMMLSHHSFYPVNPRVVEKFGGMVDRNSRWSTVENYVGNGPFRLKQWTTNQVIKVEKSPTYWDAAQVKLNEIDFFPIENLKTEETAFLGGRLHITYQVPPDKIPALRKNNPNELKIEPYLSTYYYSVNVTRKPFNDPRVREAFSLAIDRKLIVERVTLGGEAPAGGYVPTGLAPYPTATRLKYDPERARQLLAEAGYPGGKGFPRKEILINTSEKHRKIAEAIQAMWRKNLGVDVGIYNQEWKVYLDTRSKLDYDVARSGWIGDYPYPMAFLQIFTAGNGNNNTGWANPSYDALIHQAQSASSEEQRLRLMEQAETILLNDLPIIPIYWYTKVFLKDPRVKGWNALPIDIHPYKYVSF